MKTILFTAFALFLSFFAYSQTIIENPKVGMSTASNVQIVKIELSDAATVLWFHVNSVPGNWISVPGKTYIQPVGAKEKLYVVSAEGIPVDKQYTVPASGEVNYKLIFPKIDASVTKLDFGEGNEGGNWFFYDIQLKLELFKSILPEKISGSWFRADNGQWEISLFDSVAVFKSQVWKYQQYSEKDGVGKIRMRSGKKTTYLYAKSIDDKTCMIGESPAKLVKYSSTPDESVIPADNETFKVPVFKMDSITYSGYIKGLNPRFPQRTGMVYVNNVLTGNQESYVLKIADDGTFKLKFQHSNPQAVLVRFPFINESVFVEPGKSVFQMIDPGNKTNPALFMGDGARINTDLRKLKSISSYSYNQKLEKISTSSPEQYRSWFQELQQKDKDAVVAKKGVFNLCAKAIQVKLMEIDYRYTTDMMSYSIDLASAYRQKNNIPSTQREIPAKAAKLDASYYNFLTNELVNNPLAVLVSEYYFFINRLMYLDIVRGESKGFSTYDIALELEKSGYKFTPEEKEFVNEIKVVYTPELEKVQNEFVERYREATVNFSGKYGKKLQDFYKDKGSSPMTMAMAVDYLTGQGVEFTNEEKEYLDAEKKYHENPIIQAVNTFNTKNKEKLIKFNNDHGHLMSLLQAEDMISKTNENIQKLFNLPSGFAADVMVSQNFCRPVVSQMIPVAPEKLKQVQDRINNSFIVSYLEAKYNETNVKIEANKKQKGAIVNEIPKAEGDKLLDAIISKYKGKVVYIDFWATWCSPCLEGIKRIVPLKEELAKENIAFVYITGETSPKTTYDNMIPTIKGEHYRLSADDWNLLCGKFNISGIPHYMLVGKDGKIINPNLSHMDNEQLKSTLMKYIRE